MISHEPAHHTAADIIHRNNNINNNNNVPVVNEIPALVQYCPEISFDSRDPRLHPDLQRVRLIFKFNFFGILFKKNKQHLSY